MLSSRSILSRSGEPLYREKMLRKLSMTGCGVSGVGGKGKLTKPTKNVALNGQ